MNKQPPSKASDVWSLACSSEELYLEKPVREDEGMKLIDIAMKLNNKETPDLTGEVLPEGMRCLMICAFDYIPEKQPSATDFVEFLDFLKLMA